VKLDTSKKSRGVVDMCEEEEEEVVSYDGGDLSLLPPPPPPSYPPPPLDLSPLKNSNSSEFDDATSVCSDSSDTKPKKKGFFSRTNSTSRMSKTMQKMQVNDDPLKNISLDNVQRRFSLRGTFVRGKVITVESADTFIVGVDRNRFHGSSVAAAPNNTNASSDYVALRIRIKDYISPYSGYDHCLEIIKAIALNRIVYICLDERFVPDHILIDEYKSEQQVKVSSTGSGYNVAPHDRFQTFLQTVKNEANTTENRKAVVYFLPHFADIKPKDAKELMNHINFERTTVQSALQCLQPGSIMGFSKKQNMTCVQSNVLAKTLSDLKSKEDLLKSSVPVAGEPTIQNRSTTNGWQKCAPLDRNALSVLVKVDENFERVYPISLASSSTMKSNEFESNDAVITARRYQIGVHTINVPVALDIAEKDTTLEEQRRKFISIGDWMNTNVIRQCSGYQSSSVEHEIDRDDLENK